MTQMTVLQPGDPFPSLTVALPGGRTLRLLDPGGRVIVSVYSSGAIGRLVPQDVIGLAGYLREHTQAS
jgi:hypothetical protein